MMLIIEEIDNNNKLDYYIFTDNTNTFQIHLTMLYLIHMVSQFEVDTLSLLLCEKTRMLYVIITHL